MGRGGSEKSKSLEDYGVSKEEVARLTIQAQAQQIEAAVQYLTKALMAMNKAFGRNDKVRGGLVDLAASVCGEVETVSGLLRYHEGQREVVSEVLGEVVEGRDDQEKAINARYKIKLANVLEASMERQLKENKQ